MSKYGDVESCQEILEKRIMSSKKLVSYMENKTGNWTEYRDYLREAEFLKYDFKNKDRLFPKDLQKAHKKSSEEYAKAKALQKEIDIKNTQEKIIKMKKPYMRGEYLIKLAENTAEFDKEGETLHHCLKTYKEKAARGDCAILFIRTITEPETPLYTLELSPSGEIRQCRGNYNSSPTEEVNDFIKEWHRDFRGGKYEYSRN